MMNRKEEIVIIDSDAIGNFIIRKYMKDKKHSIKDK